MANSMAPKANRSTPSSTFLSTTPTKKPVANSKPDPTLKPNFTHRGACLSSNSRIPSIYPPQAHQQSFCRYPSSGAAEIIYSSQDHLHQRTKLLIELSRVALMRTLHERSVDKRRTPDPGQE